MSFCLFKSKIKICLLCLSVFSKYLFHMLLCLKNKNMFIMSFCLLSKDQTFYYLPHILCTAGAILRVLFPPFTYPS